MLEELGRCEVLHGLTVEEKLRVVSLGEEVSRRAGDRIIVEGETANAFYILLAGHLEVQKGGERVALLSPGAVVGEMALFNDDVRTSTVRTVSDARLLEIQTSDFTGQVLHQVPYAVKMMESLGRLMVGRLQDRDSALLKLVAPENPELAQTLEEFSNLKKNLLHQWSLTYHSIGRPGKVSVQPTKPVGTVADLSVAYSPGVADPCVRIHEEPDLSYDYTARGQLVGVVTNGTAVLGLGDIGPLAAKPVMEGKAVLFKRFADLDAFDIEIAEKDPDRLVDIVAAIAPTFGGINLEDIKAPECFEVERRLRERCDIPVFHDDQHGTAIIAGAGLLNALHLVEKEIGDVRVVFSGAGAAGLATARHVISLGVRRENLVLTDLHGVVHRGRGDTGLLAELATDSAARTLAEAIDGADVFVGVSAGGVLKASMLKSMARDPIVFALANPVPEIDQATAHKTRKDLLLATGRSDYPNQINNVTAFPYLFRGALDVRARGIDEGMEHAATRAIAALARAKPSREVLAQAPGISFGRDYFIPKPFDRRLLVEVSSAVAEAAMASGIARRQVDPIEYRRSLIRLAGTLA